jgi:hypothetical protein
MKLQRKPLALLLLIGFGHALAATPAPELPPDEIRVSGRLSGEKVQAVTKQEGRAMLAGLMAKLG